MRTILRAVAVWLLATTAIAADTLVLCPPSLQPELAAWRALREQQGHTLRVEAPARTVAGNQQLIQEHAADGLRSVVLIGDIGSAGAPPCGYEPLKIIRRYGPEPTVATDHVFANLDDDPAPELAVGRIPVSGPMELRSYLRRVIAYEQRRATPAIPASLRVVAAPGNFSPLIDRVLEATATRVLTDLTPAAVSLDVTYASPGSQHHPGVEAIHRRVRQGLMRPALAWVYLGHGLPRSLDVVASPDGKRPLLTSDDLADLSAGDAPPIAALLACYTGAFDAKRGCLAEGMLSHPSGPLAVVAASRVTMPYGNTMLGVELLRELFGAQRDDRVTIGAVVLAAKRQCLNPSESDELRSTLESIAAGFAAEQDRNRERVEHVWAYNLLGDPLLSAPRLDVVRTATLPASAQKTARRPEADKPF